VQQGIIYTNIDLDWFKVMVGGMILGAVILNNHLRKLSMQVRR
jgi:simple sugar transport system permease protein